MAVLYIHINKINKKKYVGITSYRDPTLRWGKNGINYKGSKFFSDGIEQFGWDTFDHIVLNSEIENDIAQQLEARIIKELKLTDDQFGYNESPGARIQKNADLDILCQSLIKNKIIKTTVENSTLLEINYRHTTNHYGLNYLHSLYEAGRINTEMDCQRGYVWTEERQQGLWDTLLFGHRIPEFHAIRKGLNYDIIDGKQRLTTLMGIINNEIPCKKFYATKNLAPLFESIKQTTIFFKDLPHYLQERILNTSCCVAEYSDVETEDITALFRKLNASMPLSDFARGIANNIFMRNTFTKYLVNHPTIYQIFSENARAKSEDEKYLIRMAILLKKGFTSLVSRAMENSYSDFSFKDLAEIKEIVLHHLDMIQDNVLILKGFKAIKSYMPIISFIIIEKNLNKEQIADFFNKILKQKYSGRGDEPDKKTIENRYYTLIKLLN